MEDQESGIANVTEPTGSHTIEIDPVAGDSTTNGEGQAAVLTYSLYHAAAQGEITAFEDYKDHLERLVTKNNSTILHIHLPARALPDNKRTCFWWKHFYDFWYHKKAAEQEEKSLNFVKWVLENPRSSDLWKKPNKKGETPLHVAARYGHTDIFELVINQWKEDHEELQDEEIAALGEDLEKIKNEVGDTVFHEAVRCNQYDVVELLLNLKPKLQDANNAGETPLYIASERKLLEIALQIRINCPSASHRGPSGRTSLHAATLRNDVIMSIFLLWGCPEAKTLVREADERGRIPLHYAASYGYKELVDLFIRIDESLAYTHPEKEGSIALHLAARNGQVKVMDYLLSRCPDCFELVDDKGRNVLHLAMESDNEKAVKWILSKPLLRNLINEKNHEGNTPLHQLAYLGSCMKSFIRDSQVDKLVFNDNNLNALDIVHSSKDDLWGQRKKLAKCLKGMNVERGLRIRKDEVPPGEKKDNGDEVRIGQSAVDEGKGEYDDIMHYIKNAREANLVVVTLIATVTFAASFTMPGGYNGGGSPDEGGAVLVKRAAFQAFVVTDTVALVLSSCAVIIHLFMAFEKNKAKVYSLFKLLLNLTKWAMFAMVVAFVTGTYAVLAHSKVLAIAACFLGCIFFLVYVGLPARTRLPDKITKPISTDDKIVADLNDPRDVLDKFRQLISKDDKVDADFVDFLKIHEIEFLQKRLTQEN